jgi:hypothetical protein
MKRTGFAGYVCAMVALHRQANAIAVKILHMFFLRDSTVGSLPEWPRALPSV